MTIRSTVYEQLMVGTTVTRAMQAHLIKKLEEEQHMSKHVFTSKDGTATITAEGDVRVTPSSVDWALSVGNHVNVIAGSHFDYTPPKPELPTEPFTVIEAIVFGRGTYTLMRHKIGWEIVGGSSGVSMRALLDSITSFTVLSEPVKR